MRIGVCTSDFKPMSTENLFKKISDFGFEVTQFSFTSVYETSFIPNGIYEIPWSVDENVLKHIKFCSDKYKIQIISVNGTYNMAYPDLKVRNEGVSRFEGFAKAVAALDCHMISLCSGTRNRECLWSPHSENNTQEAWDDMIDSLKCVIDIAEKLDIVLAVETEASNIIDTPEKAAKMMDEVGSPNLKMIIDCANLFHIGMAHRENVKSTMKHAFEVFGTDIVSAHGKDIADSEGIEFCATGKGIVDFDCFAKLLNSYDYGGDFLLHGIYDEKLMPEAIELMRKCLNKYFG